MQLMLLGNSCAGKSTLALYLASLGYRYVPTGTITRDLEKAGASNMPYLWTTIINTLNMAETHVFDHFYMHTMRQLQNMAGEWPIVIEVIDKRTNPVSNAHSESKLKEKQTRYNAQYDNIMAWLKRNEIQHIRVINMDTGFDVSELIKAQIVPFWCPPVISFEEAVHGNF